MERMILDERNGGIGFTLYPVTSKNYVELFLFLVTQPDRVDLAQRFGYSLVYNEVADQ